MAVYLRSHTHGVPDAKGSDGAADDDWDTDPDYVNDIPEAERRKGSKLLPPGSAALVAEGVKVADLAARAQETHDSVAQNEYTAKKSLYGNQGQHS